MLKGKYPLAEQPLPDDPYVFATRQTMPAGTDWNTLSPSMQAVLVERTKRIVSAYFLCYRRQLSARRSSKAKKTEIV
jgi:hypothetical protein